MYTYTTANGHACVIDCVNVLNGKSGFASRNKIHMYFRVWHEGKHWELGRYLVRDKFKIGDCVDHIDRDPRNNQISNLRIVTHAQNMSNRGKTRANTSGYIGVYKTPSSQLKRGCKLFYAKIMHNKKSMHIGNFCTAIEASRAYDMTCHNLKGEYAVLNNPDNVFKNLLKIR